MPDIRPATVADLPAIGRILARAFADDPVWAHLVRPRASWERDASRYFSRDAANRMRHGTVYVDTARTGAALWAPPDAWRVTLGAIVREAPAAIGVFRARFPRALRFLQRIEEVHPRAPHHYLAVLGTDPAHQGRGVGSALIRHVTDRADEEGLPAYLESSKEANLAFYARHGFEVTDRLQAGGGPPVWTMWREPRS